MPTHPGPPHFPPGGGCLPDVRAAGHGRGAVGHGSLSLSPRTPLPISVCGPEASGTQPRLCPPAPSQMTTHRPGLFRAGHRAATCLPPCQPDYGSGGTFWTSGPCPPRFAQASASCFILGSSKGTAGRRCWTGSGIPGSPPQSGRRTPL